MSSYFVIFFTKYSIFYFYLMITPLCRNSKEMKNIENRLRSLGVKIQQGLIIVIF